MKVFELACILDGFLPTDQVLAFKIVVKRSHSTHVEQSTNWPNRDKVECRPLNTKVPNGKNSAQQARS